MSDVDWKARAEKAEADRDRLAQAIWDARGALGLDNDGDRSPGAAIAGMGYQWFAESHVKEAKEQARDYEELLDLWDGDERREWVARAEAAEAGLARLRGRLEALLAHWEARPMADGYPRVPGDALRGVLSSIPAP